jgi:hypothetical protein
MWVTPDRPPNQTFDYCDIPLFRNDFVLLVVK